MDLPLILPDNIDRINIIELLDNYFNSENIMFDEICDKCKKKKLSIKKSQNCSGNKNFSSNFTKIRYFK